MARVNPRKTWNLNSLTTRPDESGRVFVFRRQLYGHSVV
jgi:hypothetical protein